MENWADIDIHYPQGISLSLGDILCDVGAMEDMLLQLCGRVQTWRGTSMFFQYGNVNCTPLTRAMKNMSWKTILRVELVKPLLWAAVDQKSREDMSPESHNQSTQFWLKIPVGDSTLEEKWPEEQAKRQKDSTRPQAKKQKNSKSHYHHDRTARTDRLLIEPHVWCNFSAGSQHDVKYATSMKNLWEASQGYHDSKKEKMPDWWYEQFWSALPE